VIIGFIARSARTPIQRPHRPADEQNIFPAKQNDLLGSQ
jgi:hypothetical protein